MEWIFTNMTEVSVIVKRGITTLLAMTLTTLLGFLINKFVQVFLENPDRFIPKSVLSAINQHEQEIASQMIEAKDIRERLDSIGGLATLKEEIRSQVLLPLQYPHVFFGNNASLHPNRGILLCGPPGVGKTMIAKAIAAEANVPFIALTLSCLENKYFGESSKLLQAAFSLARRIQPCILFFDEIDGMIRTRSSTDQSCVYGFKTELLNHMDGLKSKQNDAIILIGCTNVLSSLDPAVKRRMSKVYHIELPTHHERLEILKLLTAQDPPPANTLERVASATHMFSGSDLATLYREAAALRLTDQTRSPDFITSLKLAASPQDMEPHMMKLSVKHWDNAIARVKTSKGMKIDENESLQTQPMVAETDVTRQTGEKENRIEEIITDEMCEEGVPE